MRWDNKGKPYPSLMRIRERIGSQHFQYDSFRELGLGDVVMTGKERWRKHVQALDLEAYPKAMIQRGLWEIHHVNDRMDGRMDTCLGYSAILAAEAFQSIGDTNNSIRDFQKRMSQESWDWMNVKRELEDQLKDARDEISDLKYRVTSLESLVDRLVNPPQDPPREAVF